LPPEEVMITAALIYQKNTPAGYTFMTFSRLSCSDKSHTTRRIKLKKEAISKDMI
jgi:hypothetical protein